MDSRPARKPRVLLTATIHQLWSGIHNDYIRALYGFVRTPALPSFCSLDSHHTARQASGPGCPARPAGACVRPAAAGRLQDLHQHRSCCAGPAKPPVHAWQPAVHRTSWAAGSGACSSRPAPSAGQQQEADRHYRRSSNTTNPYNQRLVCTARCRQQRPAAGRQQPPSICSCRCRLRHSTVSWQQQAGAASR